MQMNNQNELDKWLDEMIDQAELDIDKVFGKQMKELFSSLSGMFNKYSSKGELTYTDMTKYNRLKKELTFIAEQIHSDYKYLTEFIQNLMISQYVENYYRSAYLYEFEAQQKMGYGQVNKTVIMAAIENPIPDLKLPNLMEFNRNDTIRRISTEITQGLLSGEGYSTISKRIEKAVGFSSTKARRVARTETHRAQVQGRIDSAEQASKFVDMTKMWDATLDRNTRDWHQKMDGKVIGKDENFKTPKGGNGPAPGHMNLAADDINCRCTALYLVNGKKPSVRRSRLDDGKTKVIPYTTYDEWKNNRI
jgi:SPP1 gp7 family putative phage head morphogenesis protein